MANFNKAFNFRGGFQVDTDVLLVRGQNVGIGSTIPTQRLDVNGIIKTEGLILSGNQVTEIGQASAGILTVTDKLDVGEVGTTQIRISTGIITSSDPSGLVTYYGDGGQLFNIPTSQWVDVDVGLGFTSIYAAGYVGVDTTDPRYVFQVGGVPYTPKAGFNTAQEGVGIESGSIWASDNISVGGTILSETGFVGVGSLITDLNASALQYGVIGSDRFDSINAGIISASEIRSPIFIGSTFTGIAQTAVGVLTTANLVFESADANRIEARGKFISTTGFLQIGSDEDVANVGDIEVVKDNDSTIYSISRDTTSRVFVGKERELGSNRQFGGLRFGGNVPASPLSAAEDLDVINYDVGNINYYLHAGSGGSAATLGEFRWIYGQGNRVLSRLTPEGELILEGNFNPLQNALTVNGNSYFTGDTLTDGSVTIGGDLTISGITSIGDLTIGGTLDFGDVFNIGANAVISGIVTVGGNPQSGQSGVVITPSGSVSASSTIAVYQSSVPTFIVESSGNVVTSGSISADANINSQLLISAPTVNVSAQLNGPSFTSDLALTSFNEIRVATIGNNANNVTFTDNIVLGTTEITSSGITVDDITINGTLGLSATTSLSLQDLSVTGDQTIGGTLDVNGNLEASTLRVIGIVTANAADITTSVDCTDLNASNDVNALALNASTATITTINTQDIIASGSVSLSGGSLSGLDSFSVTNQGSFGSLIVAGGIDVAGIVTASGINAVDYIGVGGSVTTDNLYSNSTVDAVTVTSTNLNVENVDSPTGTVNFGNSIDVASTITANTITADSFGGDIVTSTIQSPTGINTVTIENRTVIRDSVSIVDELFVGGDSSFRSIATRNGEIVVGVNTLGPDPKLTFSISGSNLIIGVNQNGSSLGSVTLPIV